VPEPRLELNAFGEVATAGLRYYGRLGTLTLDLAQTLVPSLGELRPSLRLSPEPPAEPDASPPGGQTIVIEAAAGRSGLGVFMVENTTADSVSAPVGVSAFTDPAGREVTPKVRFSPEVVALDPGDQVLVQVAASVDGTLEPGVRYAAEISIPQLSGARIPLVVRRRPPKSRTKTPRS
jgi:hypothetical protein